MDEYRVFLHYKNGIFSWFLLFLIAITVIFVSFNTNNGYLSWLFCCSKALTRDSVTVTVDAVVYYRVQYAVKSVMNVVNQR